MDAIKPLTMQEIFNISAQHLLMQGRRATIDDLGEVMNNTDNVDCAYRAPNGTKCAIGCLITDEQYDSDMEMLKVSEVVNRFNLLQFKNVSFFFVQDLQLLHDMAPPAKWRAALKTFGDQYKLNTDVVGAI